MITPTGQSSVVEPKAPRFIIPVGTLQKG